MNITIAKLIKVISTLIITGSLGLLAWQLALGFQGESLPPSLNSLFWLGTVILIAHSMEGLIAASKAGSFNQNPLRYGIYTFFVGFVGLKELSNDK